MTYCERCDRSFVSWSGFYQHRANSSNHNFCGDCSKDFPTWRGLKEHWVQSPRHSYCQYCNEHFDDSSDLEEHYEDSHWYCASCKKVFVNEDGLQQHYVQSSLHHYCLPCKRHFLSASNLRNHNNSSLHRTKDVVCPFRGCEAVFVSHSALVLHLEGGRCRSGINRDSVNKVVRQYDRDNIITDPSRLLTGGTTSDNIKYYATSRAWNGSSYECYLCHDGFDSLRALNQHLGSPTHEDRVYICPGSGCRTRFTTLSALCQHIESERCGVHKFRAVQDTMSSILGQMRRLTFD